MNSRFRRPSEDKILKQGGLILLGGLNKEAICLQVPPRAPTLSLFIELNLVVAQFGHSVTVQLLSLRL